MLLSQRYQKKTQLEHILLRPDTYIGSCEQNTSQLWILREGKTRFTNETISYVPGFYKIVDEILVNAADNKAREAEGAGGASGKKMSAIKVEIKKEEGLISVWNDGEGALLKCGA